MSIAVCGGSFDPLTLGHLDVIERAARLFDTLYVVVVENSEKRALFPAEERVDMAREATAHLSNVVVERHEGLLSEYALARGASALVRGLRDTRDFEEERRIAAVYTEMSAGRLESVFLPTRPEYAFISSTVVREYIKYCRDISALAPPAVARRAAEYFRKR